LSVVEGLFDEIDCLRLESGTRRRYVAVSGDDHERKGARPLPDLRLKLHPAHARQAQVRHDASGPLLIERGEKAFRIGEKPRGVATEP
jgi:hypothetical protein